MTKMVLFAFPTPRCRHSCLFSDIHLYELLAMKEQRQKIIGKANYSALLPKVMFYIGETSCRSALLKAE